jgi:hypothetical protein
MYFGGECSSLDLYYLHIFLENSYEAMKYLDAETTVNMAALYCK